ncbi:MAG TPA: hypothetical protein VH144_00530 [Candidatus Saccharimonadales bacterium]|nr:hypothetical protein [Candidatus Saccharimonadales bacterium]
MSVAWLRFNGLRLRYGAGLGLHLLDVTGMGRIAGNKIYVVHSGSYNRSRLESFFLDSILRALLELDEVKHVIVLPTSLTICYSGTEANASIIRQRIEETYRRLDEGRL